MHTGKEVALYCALHLPKLVQSCEAYKNRDLEQALRDTFMLCDRQLLSKEAIDEMKSLLQEEGDSTREEDSSRWVAVAFLHCTYLIYSFFLALIAQISIAWCRTLLLLRLASY